MSVLSDKATGVFAEMLNVMEFELRKDKDGYYLKDLQDGNLGDIESDRFHSAATIVDRLDMYIDDYYIRDLCDEAMNIPFFQYLGLPATVTGWCNVMEEDDPSVQKFVSTYSHEFEVIQLIERYIDLVDLEAVVVKE